MARMLTYAEAIREATENEMARDSSVWAGMSVRVLKVLRRV